MVATTGTEPRTLLMPSQAHVMHVTEASLGGLRRHLDDLMHGLHGLRIRQTLVYSAERADSGMRTLVDWCAREGIETVEVPMRRSVSPWHDVRAVRALIQILRRSAPSVLHLHSSKAGGVGRLAALVVPRVRVAYTPNGLATHLSKAFGAVEWLLGRVRTDFLVAVSASEYEEIRALGLVPPNKLVRVDSGISLAEAREAAGRTIEPSDPTVVFVGRLSYQKDPLFAAEVSALVLRAIPDARFIWVGDGELRASFLARLEALGVRNRWSLTGWVDNPLPAVAGATVCALVSRYESFGYVTLEAMALGKPMVATDVAGSRDLVASGETGLLVPLGDTTAFAAALTRLLTDAETRHRMGAAATDRAEAFSRERMARETLALYTGT